MRRWSLFLVCVALGSVALLCGLLMPVHLRALDASVLKRAGSGSRDVVADGLAWAADKNLGPARLLWQTAGLEALPDRAQLALAITNLEAARPPWLPLGCPAPGLEKLLASLPPNAPADVPADSASPPFTELAIRQEFRARALNLMDASRQPAVHELLRCRSLTNTFIFSPSQSSSGQALDAALVVCGLLLEQGKLSHSLSNAVYARAIEANLSENQPTNPSAAAASPRPSSQPIELILLDLMSLGQRFDWGQLLLFVGQIDDPETLRLSVNLVRRAEGRLPLLFSAVAISHRPAQVVRYLMDFSITGLDDLGSSLRYGEGGLKELLRRNQRCCESSFSHALARFFPFGLFFNLASDYCLLLPWVALGLKWGFYLAAGYLLAAAMHFARPPLSPLERPLHVQGFHIAREALFALGFLVVVLLLSEPFLSQESQRVEFPFRLRLPLMSSAMPATVPSLKSSFMNPKSLFTLLLFFVLQALLYTVCLVKLAEIRRQRIPARTKLRLLDNEDHLFDAGLYLGFAGTIVSLILFSLGIATFSLMAAYSSTAFGIIFVSFFKIFHLRGLRRKYLLEVEALSPQPDPQAPVAASTLASPS
jgi:hypothetical protein